MPLFETVEYSVVDILARLLITFGLSTVVATIYYRTYRGYGQPGQMASVLIIIGMALCGIIIAIGENLALSLGMVGALSIVRFRSAVKDHRDLAYMFWVIALGLSTGSGNFKLAIVLLLLMGIVIPTLEKFNLFGSRIAEYIVILSTRGRMQDQADDLGQLFGVKHELRSATFDRESGVSESTYLVRFGNPEEIEKFQKAAADHQAIDHWQMLTPEETVLV